jgi:hypothetical protein
MSKSDNGMIHTGTLAYVNQCMEAHACSHTTNNNINGTKAEKKSGKRSTHYCVVKEWAPS